MPSDEERNLVRPAIMSDIPLATNEQHTDQPTPVLPDTSLKMTHQIEPAASNDDDSASPKSVMEGAYHLGANIMNTESVQSLVAAEQRARVMIAEAKSELRDAKPNAVKAALAEIATIRQKAEADFAKFNGERMAEVEAHMQELKVQTEMELAHISKQVAANQSLVLETLLRYVTTTAVSDCELAPSLVESLSEPSPPSSAPSSGRKKKGKAKAGKAAAMKTAADAPEAAASPSGGWLAGKKGRAKKGHGPAERKANNSSSPRTKAHTPRSPQSAPLLS